MKLHGFCPKCHHMSFLQKHHVYPIRFFGRKNNNCTLVLCKDCHFEIEVILPKQTKLTKKQYRMIHGAWLQNKPPTIFLP